MVVAPSSVMNDGMKSMAQIMECASYYSDKWVSFFFNGQTLLYYTWHDAHGVLQFLFYMNSFLRYNICTNVVTLTFYMPIKSYQSISSTIFMKLG